MSEESPFAQRRAEWRAQALANFPFEIVETKGEIAFATWQELKAAGRGAPVVVGTDVGNVLEPFHPQWPRRSFNWLASNMLIATISSIRGPVLTACSPPDSWRMTGGFSGGTEAGNVKAMVECVSQTARSRSLVCRGSPSSD